MVFLDERLVSWLWPRFRSPSAEKMKARVPKQDCERGFDIADAMEMGLARELVTDFVLPLRRSSRLWKFKVQRYDDRKQYRLLSDDGAFLMYARCKHDAQCVQFFTYDPREKNSLFDPDRPAFTMSRNAAKTEWRIVQESHDNCSASPRRPGRSPRHDDRERRDVAVIRHTRHNIGHGVSYGMDVSLCGDGDGPQQEQHLFSKTPEWNEEIESLVLDFKGRKVRSSAKNFQLCLEERPGHVACQYGKIGPNTFGLDFRFPLTVIQAFGIALTTVFWS